MKSLIFVFSLLILTCTVQAVEPLPELSLPKKCNPRTELLRGADMRAQIEADWLEATQPVLTTQADAAGACDGVKNGQYGFHVGAQPNPWWQVDLGSVRQVGRIVVFNRLDYAPGLHNADTIQIYNSEDGKDWALCHDNKGVHFGGITGAAPLEARFDGEGLNTRFLRFTIPGDVPVFLHFDEVEVYAADDDTTNIALHQPADQSSLSPWSTPKITCSRVYPIQSWIDRGYRFAAYLQRHAVDVGENVQQLDAVAAKASQLQEAAAEEEQKALYLETRWVIRRLVFKNPLLNFDRLLFVKRFTQESYPDVCLNHMPWVSKPGGDLCIIDGNDLFGALVEPRSNDVLGRVHHLLNGVLGPGHVHGMDLWFDGNRIVFGYARARSEEPPEGWLDRTQSYRLRREEEPTHLFEMDLRTRKVRQITEGEWSDLDPTYAPNGDIVFVSERCGTSLQCNEYDKDETSCNLYVVHPDGSGIRRLSVNKDGDYLPHCLDDGMIGYTRWEYHERSFAFIQSLWVIRPDGTGGDALFKQHFPNPWALEDVRSIPNSRKLVAIATGHHTLAVGPLVIIDHSIGMNDPRGIAIVTPNIMPPEGGMDGVPVPEGGTEDQGGFYSTPWALSEDCFLVAYTYGDKTTNPTGYGLYLTDVYGNRELIYRDPDISCFMPIPLRSRPIPHVLPEAMDENRNFATCNVSDIALGCDGIAPEQAKYLRIAEPIGWPYNNADGGQRFGEDHRYGGADQERRNLTNWTPVRILGDVPIASDGSVKFQVPPDTAVYFQLLDANRMELRRMRSFISFQPGELRGCVGCHESREVASVLPESKTTQALADDAPAKLLPPWGEVPINFLRDVQPVLDRNCVSCHSGLSPDGGLDFFGGLIGWDKEVLHYGHNRAYETILEHKLISMSPARAQDASITPPMAYGSHKSKLIAALDDENHKDAVSLSAEDRLRLAMWIDANAPYHDRFVSKRSEKPVYSIACDDELLVRITEVHERRCAACHEASSISRLDWIDLQKPEQSLFLTAPLAAASGGTGKCSAAAYADTSDPDYDALLNLIGAAVNRAWTYPRRDLQALSRISWFFAEKRQ